MPGGSALGEQSNSDLSVDLDAGRDLPISDKTRHFALHYRISDRANLPELHEGLFRAERAAQQRYSRRQIPQRSTIDSTRDSNVLVHENDMRTATSLYGSKA